jgi:hypothetical protein
MAPAARTATRYSHPATDGEPVSRPACRERARKAVWNASSAAAGSGRTDRQARRTSGPFRRTTSANAASSRSRAYRRRHSPSVKLEADRRFRRAAGAAGMVALRGPEPLFTKISPPDAQTARKIAGIGVKRDHAETVARIRRMSRMRPGASP